METDSLYLLVSALVERVDGNAAASAWARNDRTLRPLMDRARRLIASEPEREAREIAVRELTGDLREFLTALGRGAALDKPRLAALDSRMRATLATLGCPVEPRSLSSKGGAS